jgi:hypothetical protein
MNIETGGRLTSDKDGNISIGFAKSEGWFCDRCGGYVSASSLHLCPDSGKVGDPNPQKLDVAPGKFGINITNPTSLIEIHIGRDVFTEKDILQWSSGNLETIDFATGMEQLVIEYLSKIVVAKVIDPPEHEAT